MKVSRLNRLFLSFLFLISSLLSIGKNSSNVTDLSMYGINSGDPNFDNGILINQASLSSSDLFLPPGTYYFSTPIVLNNVRSIQFQGNLVYTGPNGESAISISGQNLTISFNGSVSALKENVSYSSYSDESLLVGIDFVNVNNSTIYISEVKYFNENIRVSGIGGGCSYNKFILGIIRNSNVGLRIYQRDKNGKRGWANENTFIGGRFCNFADWNTDWPSYAIKIAGAENLPDSYHIANSLLFLKQSFEHYDTIVFAKNVCESDFLYSRLEGSKVFVRFVGSCRMNRVNSDYRGSCQLYDDRESKTIPIRTSESPFFLISNVCLKDHTQRIDSPHGAFFSADKYGFDLLGKASNAMLKKTINANSIESGDYYPAIICESDEVKCFRVSFDSPSIFYVVYYEDDSGRVVQDQNAFIKPKTDSRLNFVFDDTLGAFRLESEQRNVYLKIPSNISMFKLVFPKGIDGFQIYSMNRVSKVLYPETKVYGSFEDRPVIGYPGQLYYDTLQKVYYYWDGEKWCNIKTV